MMIKTLVSTSLIFLLMSCNVKKEEKGELPDVNIDVTADAGELPEYEINWADVNVGTTTKTVKIPKVVIVMEEEDVEVPFIDVEMPNTSEKEERTIMVEAEVEEVEHDLNIKEIRANADNLYVVSELTSTGQSLADKKMRVADQVTVKSPELNVKHYIVGARPNRVFNTRYMYVDTMEELNEKIGDYKVIYTK